MFDKLQDIRITLLGEISRLECVRLNNDLDDFMQEQKRLLARADEIILCLIELEKRKKRFI